MPPLRVRPADVAAYQAYFLKLAAAERGIGRMVLTPEAGEQRGQRRGVGRAGGAVAALDGCC